MNGNDGYGNWRKSRRSNSQGACVQAGQSGPVIGVRDTVQEGMPDRTVLKIPAAAWREFTARLTAR